MELYSMLLLLCLAGSNSAQVVSQNASESTNKPTSRPTATAAVTKQAVKTTTLHASPKPTEPYNAPECVKQKEQAALDCLIKTDSSKFNELSNRLQENLYVDFSKDELGLFCGNWSSTAKHCLKSAVHDCGELESAWEGTVQAYNYLCDKEDGKKKYEKVKDCAQNLVFKEQSEVCVKAFQKAVSSKRLDSRFATINRYRILTDFPDRLNEHWSESCSRVYEFIHCHESVLKYCGHAKYDQEIHHYENDNSPNATKLRKDAEREREDTEKKAKEFQGRFMHLMFERHLSKLECGRLSRLAWVFVILACIVGFLIIICGFPYLICRERRTQIVKTPSQAYGMDNQGYMQHIDEEDHNEATVTPEYPNEKKTVLSRFKSQEGIM